MNKKINLLFSNLYTTYSSNLFYIFPEGDLQSCAIARQGDPCFRGLFNLINNLPIRVGSISGKLSIKVLYDLKTEAGIEYNNLCYLTPLEVVRWLEFLQSLFPFTFLIEGEYIHIRLTEPINFLQLKYLCNTVRFLYEQPKSLILREIFNLVDAGIVHSPNLMNIYSFFMLFTSVGDDQNTHRYGKVYKMITTEVLKQRLQKAGQTSAKLLDFTSTLTYDLFDIKSECSKLVRNLERTINQQGLKNIVSLFLLSRTSTDISDEMLLSPDYTVKRYLEYYMPFADTFNKCSDEEIFQLKTTFE